MSDKPMKSTRAIFLPAAVLVAGSFTGCATVNDVKSTTPSSASAESGAISSDQNPLTARWSGSYGGLPPFDRVQIAQFKPALESAMAENLAEVDRIAVNPASPTFENTIAAMERTGRANDRVQTIYGVWSSTMNGPEFQAVEREMAPKLAAFSDRLFGERRFFDGIFRRKKTPESRLSAALTCSSVCAT